MKSELHKVEWWYDDAMFCTDRGTLPLACLRVFDNGAAEVLFEQGRNDFASEQDAVDFLTEDEYLRLSHLAEEYGLNVKLPALK